MLVVGFAPEASFWHSHNCPGKWATQYTCQEDQYHACCTTLKGTASVNTSTARFMTCCGPCQPRRRRRSGPNTYKTLCRPTTACHTLQLASRHLNLLFGQEPHLAVDTNLTTSTTCHTCTGVHMLFQFQLRGLPVLEGGYICWQNHQA